MNADIIYEISAEELLNHLHRIEGMIGTGIENAECVVLKPKMSDEFLEVRVLYDTNQSPRHWIDYKEIKEKWEEQ